MGLSMAKGAGVPEELLPTIFGLYMWDDDKSVRAAARTMFFKHAPAEIQAKVKENWKPSYRTLPITGDKLPFVLGEFVKELESGFAERALHPIIKMIEGEMGRSKVPSYGNRLDAVKVLGKIGDSRAVEPLIKALRPSRLGGVGWLAAYALGDIGDSRAVEPLIKVLEVDSHARKGEFWGDSERRCQAAARALGKIGDERAVEPLAKALENEGSEVREAAVLALGKFGELAVEPLIKALGDENYEVRLAAAGVLGAISDSRAVEPLSKMLNLRYPKSYMDGEWSVRRKAAEALGEIGDSHAVEPLIKALGDEHNKVRIAAAKALGDIGDPWAVEPLIKALEDKANHVREAAKEALKKLDTEVE
jgi:HEAT repeat protein